MNRRGVIPHLLLLFGFAALYAAEDYADWTRSATLLLDTSPNGADVTAAVTGFPILVRLASGNFPFVQARGKGQDIRFSKTNGVHLDYEIERWDSAANVAEIWVRVDTVLGATAGQALLMHWGNPAAADSSDAGAVFNNGYAGAWHLGAPGTAVRPNAVAGAPAAAPVNYDGNETVAGMIGRADSLDGGAPGDHLDIGDGYADFSAGLTYSVWAYPTAAKRYGRFLDMGNGPGVDEIIFGREDVTNNLRFDSYQASGFQNNSAPNVLVMNQWQCLAVTLSGNAITFYRNGVQVGTGTLNNPLSGSNRVSNFLGKSNWTQDEYYQGRMDQAELSKVARSPAWIKLGHENQKAAQTLVSFRPDSGTCQVKFAVPPDTAAPEGGRLDLAGLADCALGYSWSAVSGPAPRIVDPQVKLLQLSMPRITQNTVLVYRFAARFADSTRSRDVRVRVKEAIPDPLFTLPAGAAWNGRDSLVLRPTVANLAAVKASPDSIIRYAWTLADLEADTAWLPGALLLRNAAEYGVMKVTLCLDNGGTVSCKTAEVTISPPTALRRPTTMMRRPLPEGSAPGRDAAGRRPSVSAPGWTPRFFQVPDPG